MSFGRTEENSIWDNDCGPATRLEQTEEESQEEKFGLLGLDDLLEILGTVLVVE